MNRAEPQLVPRRMIEERIASCSKEMENHLFLTRLKTGVLPLNIWQMWGIQRYNASDGFLVFLDNLLSKAQTNFLKQTEHALYENFCDEKGISPETGKPLKIGPHQTWRENFYTALEMFSGDFEHAKSFPATQAYADLLSQIQNAENLWGHLGFFLALEYIIGREMEIIQAGLENTPELKPRFVLNDSTIQNRAQIVRNRMYVVHHAAHDLQQHFPELLEAIIVDMEKLDKKQGEIALKEMLENISAAGSAKARFYDDILQACELAQC
jgi:hypothetical protein